MAKTEEKPVQGKEAKSKKEPKEKNGNALVGRVKKVVKKSRRKMGDEKFEKQLQRTIAFLEEFQIKMAKTETRKAEKKKKPAKPKNSSQQKKAKPAAKTKSGSTQK